MTDKQLLREVSKRAKHAGEAPVMPFDQRMSALKDFQRQATPDTVLALLDELEASAARIVAMSDALRHSFEAHAKTIRAGYERIIDLGGECDAPDEMIAGNPDIQQAKKILADGTANGEAPQGA